MMKAYVLVNTQTGQEQPVKDRMAKIEGVTEAECVYGVYDVVVAVEHENVDKLKEIVTWKLRRVDGVKSTLTLAIQA